MKTKLAELLRRCANWLSPQVNPLNTEQIIEINQTNLREVKFSRILHECDLHELMVRRHHFKNKKEIIDDFIIKAKWYMGEEICQYIVENLIELTEEDSLRPIKRLECRFWVKEY